MERFFKKFYDNLNDLPIFLLCIFFTISILGIVLLFFVSYVCDANWGWNQMKYFCCFCFLGFFISCVNIKIIYKYSYLFFIFCILLLFLVYFKGKYVMGAKRWIEFFGYTYQPSEIAKLGIILFFARYFHNCDLMYGRGRAHLIKLIFPILVAIFITVLIASHPDLGTAMIFLIVSLIIFFLSGYHIGYFIFLASSFIIASPILWNLLKDYQKKRLFVFFNSDFDIKGSGYNLLQSKIAIGSGGLFGKGALRGTQGHLKFLPEYQTDFIFSYFAEEFGFVGCIILLLLYFSFIFSLFRMAYRIESIFHRTIILGFAVLVFTHCFINIAMVMGVLPIVGIPLPFLSYGGSMESTMIIGVALCINAHLNRRVRIY